MKKKKVVIGSLIALVPFAFTIPVYAETRTGYVDATSGLYLRKGPGTTYEKLKLITNRTQVDILDEKATDDFSTGCPSNNWYHVKTPAVEGYACSQYIIINETPPGGSTSETITEMATMTDEEFENYLVKEGFPSSYISKLKALHKSHPNWVFKGIGAKYTWQNALSQENEKGRSLYQVTSTGVKNGLQGYLNTGSDYYNYSTDTFKAYDGTTWFQANNETISYYMDPRNFLTESGIFMFEDLTYYQSYQTKNVIQKILYTDFYKNYLDYFIEAAAKYNVSPVYLAALARQEVGLNASTATSGNAGTYNGVNYNGYYNFYNIGASSGSNPVYNGLAYAKQQGWDTPQKAIVEGAKWIVSGYISRGQYTRYFQKWNVSPTTATGIWHQYMTDVHALVSPSATTASSYNSIGVINEPLVFSIPIYSGMPESTKLPPTGNPNNWLKDLKIDGTTINGFNSSTTSYSLGEVNYEKTKIKISSTTINQYASVDIDGEYNLNVGKNTINIVVSAQNGAKKTYTLTITRKEQVIVDDGGDNGDDNGGTGDVTPTTPETPTEPTVNEIINSIGVKYNNSNLFGFSLGYTASTLQQNILKQNDKATVKITDKDGKNKTSALVTGDKVTITSNNETKSFEVVIYGDLNGDGGINAKDLLLMRKYLLKEVTLNGSFLESAKLVRSTSVSAKDLLLMRKHLLGTDKIKQD